MQTIQELLDNKLYRLVEVMIQGLEEFSQKPNFKIDMSTFGEIQNDICYGCAATCALQLIAEKEFSQHTETIKEYMHSGGHLGTNHIEISNDSKEVITGFKVRNIENFECVVNQLRCGNPNSAYDYMDISAQDADKIYEYLSESANRLNFLNSKGWQEDIGNYKRFAQFLKENNI
jgi:hypothetical protein